MSIVDDEGSADRESDAGEGGGEGGKSGKAYKPGNTRDDGSYVVGRGRTSKATRFAVGDGRARGRHPKGTKNFDTEFSEEAARLVPVMENGKVRRVSKRRATLVRLLDNAYAKGQNAAIDQVLQHSRRMADKASASRGMASVTDDELINAFLRDRAAFLGTDPALLGDPEPVMADDDPEPADGDPEPSVTSDDPGASDAFDDDSYSDYDDDY